MTWTKGFKATDCEGEDVVELLREAIKRKEVIQPGGLGLHFVHLVDFVTIGSIRRHFIVCSNRTLAPLSVSVKASFSPCPKVQPWNVTA